MFFVFFLVPVKHVNADSIIFCSSSHFESPTGKEGSRNLQQHLKNAVSITDKSHRGDVQIEG